jgi:hypothetical protein
VVISNLNKTFYGPFPHSILFFGVAAARWVPRWSLAPCSVTLYKHIIFNNMRGYHRLRFTPPVVPRHCPRSVVTRGDCSVIFGTLERFWAKPREGGWAVAHNGNLMRGGAGVPAGGRSNRIVGPT